MQTSFEHIFAHYKSMLVISSQMRSTHFVVSVAGTPRNGIILAAQRRRSQALHPLSKAFYHPLSDLGVGALVAPLKLAARVTTRA